MKLRIACVIFGFLSLVLSLVQLTFAQAPIETASALPRLVRFSGTVKDLNSTPLTGVVGITFALDVYKRQVWDHSSRKAPYLPVIRMGDGTLRYRASRIEEFIDERERLTQIRRKRA